MDRLALDVTEAAALLGVSRPTVYALLRREDFPRFKIGRRTKIPREGLEAWVRRQAEEATEGETA